MGPGMIVVSILIPLPSHDTPHPRVFLLQGGGEHRIWFMTLTADKDYPNKPPAVKFTSKINMDCVDAKGNVSFPLGGAPPRIAPPSPSLSTPVPASPHPLALSFSPLPPLQVIAAKVPYLASWNSSKTLHGTLQEIKGLIARAPRAQPADGTTY
jgi:hypothetical protein